MGEATLLQRGRPGARDRADSPATRPGAGSLFMGHLAPIGGFLAPTWQWCKVKVKVAQLCLILRDPTDHTVHRILQARILEWAAFPSPGDLPSPRTEPPTLQADSSPAEPQGSPRILEQVAYPFPSRSSRPRHQTRVSRTAGGFFTNWAN